MALEAPNNECEEFLLLSEEMWTAEAAKAMANLAYEYVARKKMVPL